MALSNQRLVAMCELAEKGEPGQVLMFGDAGATVSGGSWSDELFKAMLDILDERHNDEVREFIDRYKGAKDEDELALLVQTDMLDNYILGGLALAKIKEVPRSMPAIAWAAYNKHTYQGYAAVGKDDDNQVGTEFALVRTLQWAGFDLNAQDESGYTAMHYFASTKPHPFTNARAVNWLLKNGADASVANGQGDTPLIYLSASVRWTHELTASFVTIFKSKTCDPWVAADDGKTARMILEENDPMAPHEERQAILAQLVRMEMEADLAPGKPGRKRGPLVL